MIKAYIGEVISAVMDVLYNTIISILKTVSLINIIDILLVFIIIYQLMKLVKDTRVAQILKGVALLVAAYIMATLLGLKTIGFLLTKVFEIGIIALIVVFQPELRRMLEHMGQTQVSNIKLFTKSDDAVNFQNKQWIIAIDAICNAVCDFSKSNTGALIVLERTTKLQDIIDTGTILDSVPSKQLIENIFFKNSPLHDGGVVFRDGKLFAAACLLPLSQNTKISKELGTRHRAGLGISEVSDAVVIIVSEETGVVSLCQSGHLARSISNKGLRNRLQTVMITNFEKENE